MLLSDLIELLKTPAPRKIPAEVLGKADRLFLMDRIYFSCTRIVSLLPAALFLGNFGVFIWTVVHGSAVWGQAPPLALLAILAWHVVPAWFQYSGERLRNTLRRALQDGSLFEGTIQSIVIEQSPYTTDFAQVRGTCLVPALPAEFREVTFLDAGYCLNKARRNHVSLKPGSTVHLLSCDERMDNFVILETSGLLPELSLFNDHTNLPVARDQLRKFAENVLPFPIILCVLGTFVLFGPVYWYPWILGVFAMGAQPAISLSWLDTSPPAGPDLVPLTMQQRLSPAFVHACMSVAALLALALFTNFLLDSGPITQLSAKVYSLEMNSEGRQLTWLRFDDPTGPLGGYYRTPSFKDAREGDPAVVHLSAGGLGILRLVECRLVEKSATHDLAEEALTLPSHPVLRSTNEKPQLELDRAGREDEDSTSKNAK